MNSQKVPDEDYNVYSHIYRKKGKKFWNANIRDCRQPASKSTSASSTKSDSEVVECKIIEIVNLRKLELQQLSFTPNAFLVSLTHKEEPILQELAPLGYYIADRCQGLTFEEAKLAITKLGEIHADYLAYYQRPCNIITQQRAANRVYRVPDISKDIAYAAFIAAKTYTYLPNFEKLLHKVKENVDRIDAKMQNVLQGCWTGDNDVRVLNHGDAWLNNFIFKQENEILKDAQLLRSQMPRYGSPGLDLNFFLHTSLNVDVLKQKRMALLCFYHESLRQKMSPRHWFVPPSMDAILKEVRRSEFYSFYAVMCELPLVCLQRDQCDNLLWTNFSDKIFVKKISYNFFKCPRVLETIQYTLERLDQIGVLDEVI